MRNMQLKKRFSVRNGVAAGAMAVALFAGSLPAMASNGAGAGVKMELSVQGEGEHAKLERKGRLETSGMVRELKELNKDVRHELRDGRDRENATSTGQTEAAKLCRKTSKDTFAAATLQARTEKEASMKSALETYLAAIKSARAAYHASIDVGTSTSPTSTDGFIAARLTYRTAIENAKNAFRDAKTKINADYRAKIDAATTARKTANQVCASK